MTPQILKLQLKAMTTRAALLVLIQKGRGDIILYWDSQRFTPKSLLRIENILLCLPCGDFGTVRFYGGPPKQGKWFDGSILTLLCDCFLFDSRCDKSKSSEECLAT